MSESFTCKKHLVGTGQKIKAKLEYLRNCLPAPELCFLLKNTCTINRRILIYKPNVQSITKKQEKAYCALALNTSGGPGRGLGGGRG